LIGVGFPDVRRRLTLLRMTIYVDLDVVGRHRECLLGDALEIERRAVLDRPDSGPVRAVTDLKLERIEERAHRLAELMTGLADALDRWLVAAHATDGEVAVDLDLLTSGVLAL
jgi:hypothetical protein